MATVWVYPERTFEKLGAVRWQASWEQVKKSAEDNEEIDPDCDIDYLVANYQTKEAAMKRAQKIIAAGITAFGAVTVTKQVVDWYVEEDKIAEWADTLENEEVSS
jgi:hypothetical protein